ncbi:hypothetical protein N431DRAFT_495958 [Stipitochalara longipes BDJ]|nr:hypothetical protein N431DRAFT_495958 [Stipitochalara longipes BDJ]
MFSRRRTFPIIAGLAFFSILCYLDRFSRPWESPKLIVYEEELRAEETFDALNNLCSKTKWTEGLWLHCHSYCGENKTSACGGLNNARNRIQTCLRLAIDIGAGTIIPSVTWRNEDDLANTGSYTACADRFWDMEHLQVSLARGCPQLKIRLCDDRSSIKNVIPTRERGYMQASYSYGTFRPFINTALEMAGLTMTDINAENSAVVSYGDTFMAWNYNISKELTTIRKELFKTITFSQALLDVSSQIHQSPVLQDNHYIGIHFRGESDWPEEFGSAADQMQLYTEELLRIRDSVSYDLNTVYISCGDQEAINRFRTKLVPLGFEVVDKTSILQGGEKSATLAAVEELDFDQKGVVEYETLVRSTFFLGIVMSTMSCLIAYARTVDDEKDFFETYVFPGSWNIGIHREYPAISMKGNRVTKLMVVSGVDVMNLFP